MKAKTSETDPIRVDWLDLPWDGKVGLTFAPGKKDAGVYSGPWDRDLKVDLEHLRHGWGVRHLVCLIEDHEFTVLHIPELPELAPEFGLEFHRLPIRDVHVPERIEPVREMVARIARWALAGETVVIHCRGGVGRSGVIGGCVLRVAGLDGEAALAELQRARGPHCPETDAQVRYVMEFDPAPVLGMLT
jgi:hypothetical protein